MFDGIADKVSPTCESCYTELGYLKPSPVAKTCL